MTKKPKHGADKFSEYAAAMAAHQAFADMPDPIGKGGKIQWETPSNRKSGQFKDSRQKRLDWWKRRADSVGVNWREEKQWISRVAKMIHPTQVKPCKVCGREMAIPYSYPNVSLQKKVAKLPYYTPAFIIDPDEHIAELVARLVATYGDRVFGDLPKLLKTPAISVPVLPARLEVWQAWLQSDYIPREPTTLGPGGMSNAPDRFDGFHSFNRCCRALFDTGRKKENLASYGTDRRAFGFWVDGDWVAANRLMGLVRSDGRLKQEPCRFGHPGPCAADHIGPISLGFAHRPEFQFLCGPCNNGKGNRMFLSDVEHLRNVEEQGQAVTSWYCKALWDARKRDVDSKETAERLSKMLRDNRHTALHLLNRVAQAGHYTFLTTLLNLSSAEQSPSFVNLRVEGHITKHDGLAPDKKKKSEYVLERKAYRIRVGFDSLLKYPQKARNALLVSTPEIDAKLQETLDLLTASPDAVTAMDVRLQEAVRAEAEAELRELAEQLPAVVAQGTSFSEARDRLAEAMSLVADYLSAQWEEDRYVRTTPADFAPEP